MQPSEAKPKVKPGPKPRPTDAKVCKVCGVTFNKNINETYAKYANREVCGIECALTPEGKALVSARRKARARLPTGARSGSDEIQCTDCRWLHDLENGDHCGPCTTGQRFQRRTR